MMYVYIGRQQYEHVMKNGVQSRIQVQGALLNSSQGSSEGGKGTLASWLLEKSAAMCTSQKTKVKYFIHSVLWCIV